jgi:hypothetical protein
LIPEEIYRILNSVNACYDSVQNLLSSRLLSKSVKCGIYKPIILSVVFYGRITWSLPLREEHRLSVFENRVLRRLFGPSKDEVTGGWRKLSNEELNNLHTSPSIIGVMKSRRMRWAGYVAQMVIREMHVGYWWENQNERAIRKTKS